MIVIKKREQKSEEPQSPGRRVALTALGLLGVSVAARSMKLAQPGKAKSSDKGIAPPGAVSVENLKDKCTSCNECISSCPNGIIKPALLQYGADGIMLPVLSYENHFCAYDCTVCSSVCPTGALSPLTVDAKRLTQIGTVNFVLEDCIVYKDGTDCGACDEHCPTKAIKMVPYEGNGLMIPSTNKDICIGCGGCEYICPAKPKAMIVSAKSIQGKAQKPSQEEQKKVKVDEFGF